ncbi:putative RND superfamily exporter protein [Natronobacillus azotifigens]|uniref:MMPL family transporter n=1 Tax=Natronobacillus azotifigens TaxID=472978 RepID=A0A9J6RET0_9BACI|nr:MMPL family transporter [Natronobacillus azotifigens]MCZ0703876.1 MMPL family transporter [Natronobacillus azotifigens]
MEELLPEDSEAFQAITEFETYFESQESGIVVVKGEAETSKAFLTELEQELVANGVEGDFLYKVDVSELNAFGPLYLDISLFEELEMAIDDQNTEQLTELLTTIQEEQTSSSHDTVEYMSNEAENVFLMMMRFYIDNTDFLETRERIYDDVRASIDELLEKSDYQKIEAGLTGGAFIQDIEADRVALDGFFGTFFITILLIVGLIMISFRKVLLLTTVIYPLLLGALTTAAVAYLLYGAINLFSVSFALLLVGLGIDFSIHLLSRYLEEREQGQSTIHAIETAMNGTGNSIIIGALTTSTAFFTFIFAQFNAFEQMGVISSIGIILLCVAMIILVPAFIMLVEKNKPFKNKKKIRFTFLDIIGRFLEKRSLVVILVALLLLPLFFSTVRDITVIGNLDAVYPEDIDSRAWADLVEDEFDYNTNTLTFMVDEDATTDERLQTLKSRDDVEEVLSIYDYLPEQQEKKLEIIHKLNHVMKQVGYTDDDLFPAQEMQIDDLPDHLIANFVGKDGMLLAELIPSVNIYDETNYQRIASAIHDTSGNHPVGMASIMNEIVQLAQNDILFISLLCMLIIGLFLLCIFRSFKLMIISVVPLLLTLYVTIGLLPMLGQELNILSIAGFPLLIGIGIDSSIHLLHRLQTRANKSVGYVLMTTGKAIILSTLTTSIGFGSLIFINHPGMAQLGITVSLGLLICLVITLTVLPSLWLVTNNKGTKKSN